jgi:hypothetical protein
MIYRSLISGAFLLLICQSIARLTHLADEPSQPVQLAEAWVYRVGASGAERGDVPRGDFLATGVGHTSTIPCPV